MMKKRMLILEDGTIFEGIAFGSDEASIGETVFTTGMTGYQETISNPSGAGQIIVMTYPLIGNYGINRDDYESIEPAASGLVVRELADEPSNFRSGMTLCELLTMKGIPGIQGIDTRKLTRLLRDKGALKGILTAAGEEVNVEETVAHVASYNITDRSCCTRFDTKTLSKPRSRRANYPHRLWYETWYFTRIK